MSELRFGWHMHSFPVDGSSGPAFVDQIHHTLDCIQSHFDSVWVDDHMLPWAQWQSNDTPYLDCLTTIPFFSAAYPALKFGSHVLCQSYRNPGLLAKTAANLQLLTGGRFLCGIGAGWLEEEYHAYDFDFPKPSVRIAQLEEAVQVVKKLWTESPASFKGTYYRIENAYCEPRPDPLPPLMIGGGGEQLTLRVVAKHADWWNVSSRTPEDYSHKLNVLRRHCATVGRDYDEIVKTWTVEAVAVAMTESEAQDIAGATPYSDNPITGTPAQVVERLQGFVDLGAEYLIVRLVDFPSTKGIELFAHEVIPRLSASS